MSCSNAIIPVNKIHVVRCKLVLRNREVFGRFEFVENKKECTQDKSKYRNKIEEGSCDQAIKTQREWASTKLMELIEAVPYHEQFIHSF